MFPDYLYNVPIRSDRCGTGAGPLFTVRHKIYFSILSEMAHCKAGLALLVVVLYGRFSRIMAHLVSNLFDCLKKRQKFKMVPASLHRDTF